MQTFGLIYLIAYLADCIVSIIATLMPMAEGLSNVISSILSLCAILVIVLSCLGKLRPRRTFLVLSIFYVCMIAFGIVLGILLAIDLGPDIATQEITIQFLHEHFTWYPCVHWSLLIMWTAIAIYGFWSRSTGAMITEPKDGQLSSESAPCASPDEVSS